MLMTLVRKQRNEEVNGIFGELTIDIDRYHCYTVENATLSIPVGTYDVTFYNSPKNKILVPLLSVPGRSEIEIHIANRPVELEGCVAVGEGVGIAKMKPIQVVDSKKAFDRMMEVIKNQKGLKIVVREA